MESDLIRRHLEQILASPGFGSAERRGRLLKYLVEKALAGEPVKEYGIGIDVFEKPPDYDPRTDPSVRVEIGRLRTRLNDFYSSAGNRTALRIDIPKGSYVPVFRAPVTEPDEPRAETGGATPGAGLVSEKRISATRLSPALLVGACLAVAIAALVLVRFFPRDSGINSVVVLPFENLTGNPANGYLADGITEQLTDALAQVSSLRVVARTSAFQFKGKAVDIREIGRAVNADAVVEGSLGSLDGNLRVTVQVNRSRDGYHIYSGTFDGGPKDLGRLETQMAQPVLASMRPKVATARRSAPDPDAYNLFLKARAYRGEGTKAASDEAISYLNQAIEHDPRYADAYAALAGVYSADAVNLAAEPISYANQARAAALKALEFDPASAPAYSALGEVDSLVLLDWKQGEQELRKSIALMPQSASAHNHLGILLMAEGRFPEAFAELRKAYDLDPLVTAPGATLGLAYFLSRDYEAALRQFTHVRDMHPESVLIHSFIGLAWEGKNQFDRAMAEYKLAQVQSPAATAPMFAHLLAQRGKRSEALAMLKTIEAPGDEPPPAFDIAAVYAALGDRDAAFRWLNKSYDQRSIFLLKVHPFFDPLRSDPRFAELLRRIGLN